LWDCTRLRVLRIYPQLNQTTAIQFLDYVLSRLPFQVEMIPRDERRLDVLHPATTDAAYHLPVEGRLELGAIVGQLREEESELLTALGRSLSGVLGQGCRSPLPPGALPGGAQPCFLQDRDGVAHGHP
jgi:hypothetical protein